MTRRPLPHTVFAAALVLSATACGLPNSTEQGSTEQLGTESAAWSPFAFGWGMWGIGLNGRTLDGQDLTHRGLIGVSLDGVRLRGRGLSVTLEGSALRGAGAAGMGDDGRNLVGATFAGILDDGSSLSIRLDGRFEDRQGGDADVHLYAASYETDTGDRPLCGLDAAGNPVRAVALAGRWDYRVGVAGGGSHIADPTAFTFACEGYVLAKCVELGYRPWDSIRACPDGHGRCPLVSMADLHQACTRAFRADYCGDGVSYTVDGTRIDVYDGYGYRTASPGWPLEAEWTTEGARCAARLRVPSQGTPTCWSRLQNTACGASSDFSAGTLLMTQDSP